MTRVARNAALLALILPLSALALTPASSEAPLPANAIRAVTKPSKDVVLSFPRPGLLQKVLVKEGDIVKAGQEIARQDDTEEQAAFEVAQQQAEDNTRAQAQEKIRDQKEVAYRRKRDSSAATQVEIEEALLDWEVGKANVRLSDFEHAQDARKALQAKAALEKTRLHSPIDGIVEELYTKEGEITDAQNPKVLRVVNLDPLWIEAPVRFDQAIKLKLNNSAEITFSDNTVRTGKIVNIANVADSGSSTLTVRIEIPNPQHLRAGEHVIVSFSDSNPTAQGNNP